ncbi:MAG: 5'/3'-nucleotidase SurE [Flavobacteriales bacterium]|nr:5'/3'-nucleotidase SurE [Flavobacteriales bacterium]|tara:strand:+ start:17970 stop:18746 length:777 start_codon:yes stop_codon:yes gene_type:complete
MSKPLILVVNDDGISASGIRNLIRIMNDFGDVVVVAPNSPQSGKSHAITIEATIRCDKVVIDDGPQEEYACSGTPVDCVKLAVNQILDRKPDLCVSGINHGSNSSINVIYSGTMSAALEGALEDIPSVGFSLLDYDHNADFSEAEPYIREIVKRVINNGLDSGVCLNVNIPKSLVGKTLKGLKVCRQANANWEEEFEARTDPKGKVYYWLTGKFINYDKGVDTDEWALANHYISVVPVQFDVTAHSSLSSVNKLLLDE